MDITQLETKRRAAQRDLDLKLAPQRQIDLAAQELADLDEQIEIARQQEQEAQRAANQKAAQIADAWARYNAITQDLRAALRSIHAGRLALVSFGESDPGDRVISVESIVAPLLEVEQRAYATMRTALTKDWASPEQVAANARRHDLMAQLMNSGRLQQDAEAIADLVVDGKLDLEVATAQYDAVPEEDNNDDT